MDRRARHNIGSPILAICFLIVLNASMTTAAPAPWGIAINEQTKECAGYWAGDEYIVYSLPKGWEQHTPDSSTGIITTQTGICRFIELTEGEEEKCCQAMGYPYLSKNIGGIEMFKGFMGILLIMAIASAIATAIVIWLIIIQNRKKKKRARR